MVDDRGEEVVVVSWGVDWVLVEVLEVEVVAFEDSEYPEDPVVVPIVVAAASVVVTIPDEVPPEVPDAIVVVVAFWIPVRLLDLNP